MSGDNPTFAEIAEENIRQYRKRPAMTTEEEIEEWSRLPYEGEDTYG